MKLTRLQLLKGLLATVATGILVPSALVESVRGASDLTAQERDIAAEVIGLRRKQWPGVTLPPVTAAWMTIPVTDERRGFGELTLPVSNGSGGYLVPPDVRDRVLMALGHPSRVSAAERENAKQVIDSWFWRGDNVQGEIWTTDMSQIVQAAFDDEMRKVITEENRIAEDRFLHGVPGGQMPVGILRA